MAEGTSAAAKAPADRILVITRVFDAPREAVFKAWIEPERIVQWLGPRGFHTSIVEAFDVRPGGRYRFHMRSPEGTEHWQQGVYREIVPPERLVMTYVWADAAGNPTRPETLLALTFAEHGAKTELTLHQSVFESVTACDAHRGGWNSTLDKLAEYIATAA